MSVVLVAKEIAEIEDDDFFLIFLIRMRRFNSLFSILHVRGRVYTKYVYSLFVNAVHFFSEDKFGPEFDLKLIVRRSGQARYSAQIASQRIFWNCSYIYNLFNLIKLYFSCFFFLYIVQIQNVGKLF